MLQQIDNYGMLAKMLFDLQMPPDSNGKNSLLCGTRQETVLKMPTIGLAAADTAAAVKTVLDASISAKGLAVQQVNSGERLGGDGALLAAAGTITTTYCLSLISLVGVLCSQNYIPLFEMSAAPLRCEIQLVDQLVKACNVLVNTTPSSAQFSNVEYVGNFIELGDPAVAMIRDSLGGQPLQFVVPDYRNFTFNYTTTNAAAASLAMPIPAKFSSVKAIFISIRDQNTGAASFFPYSSVTRNILDYQFRIGANIFPSKQPSSNAEMFAEALKAISSLSDINHQPSIDKTSYSLQNSVNTAAL